MKDLKGHKILVLIGIMAVSFLVSCKNGDKQQKTIDMIKARTMGLAYIEENKLPEAEETFKQLIKIAPNEALGYANLGLVYIRMGDFNQAEEQLKQALNITPNDPEIQLNYAEVMQLTSRGDQAIDLLEESIKFNPDHIRTLYKLGQNYAQSGEPSIRQNGKELLLKVVNFLPTNITARLDLVELFLKEEKADLAAEYFEKIKAQMPVFPEGADEYYQKALTFMMQNNGKEALQPFNIFRNILKPTPLYKVGFDELKGMGGPLIGTPVITFYQDLNLSDQSQQTVLDAIRFTDATDAAGLNILPNLKPDSSDSRPGYYRIATADFDGNGTQDLYASVWYEQEDKISRYLLSNNFGKFIDITTEAGINHMGIDKDAIFTDYDNDGYLDLFIVNSEGNVLYYHYAAQKFRNVANEAGIKGDGSGNAACFADFDHDGDLDLYLATQTQNKFYRNNLDGSFSETSQKMNVSGANSPSNKAVYADFDDDGDIDLFVLNSETSNTLYSNLRQGQFADVTSEWGLSDQGGSTAIATGDYNNDGLLDLLITNSTPSGYTLFANKNGTEYEEDNRSSDLQSILQNYICSDVHFFDFDNDGFLDLVFAGKPKQKNIEGRGILLFHNNGKGVFADASNLLPQIFSEGIQIEIADYNEDGDQDIFFSGANGRVHLLRNDGGNANHYLKVQLVGLRTGSGKNNYFGIGAKLEVKAGELYQSHIVNKPVSHFGLGQKTKADVVRVLWTNGVPQNLFEPGSDQALLEKQILKGSCPFLYAWNGEEYEFVTDVLWRSALGMPLGIMGGETAYAFADPAEDYFKIPGDMLKEKEGTYAIQFTAELWETAYFDQVKLMVVDHPDTTDIYVDERFTPPPFPPFNLFHVTQKKYPKSIVDGNGNNIGQITRYEDDVYVSNLSPERYQGTTKLHDLLIDFGNISELRKVVLYMKGWVFPTDASINVAMAQSSENLVHPPILQVKNKKGQWETVIKNMSFPMGKNKYVILDLSDKFLTDNYQVRIRTSMQIYWDYIFYTDGEQSAPFHVNTLSPKHADLHYRGFSRMYRKAGRYGPFWFDYDNVSLDPKWRDLEGNYTRYGDVRDLLLEADSKYIITNAGDEISVEFEATTIPELPAGWSRDFVIYTNGWLKDGDLNTAQGQLVEPLPFRGMSKYPYGEDEHYPTDIEHQDFLKNYITRKVTTEKYKRQVIDK